MYGQLTLLVIASIVSPTIIAIAGIVVAVVVVIGGVLVYRSGKNKGTKAPSSAGQTDWQRQSQLGGAGGWNQQAMGNNMGGVNSDAPSWAQQSQQMGQAGWNNQGMGMAQQGQQGQPGTWSAGQDVPSQVPSWAAQANQATPSWGPQNNPNSTQQASWQGAQQSSSPSWAAQNSQPQQPQPAAPPRGNQGFQTAQGPQGGQAPWDVNQPIAAQDSWGMQVPGMAQNQGMQQPQTSYGGGNASASSWNQPGIAGAGGAKSAQSGPNDAWSAGIPQAPQGQHAPLSGNNALGGFSAVPANGPAQAPSWQQNNGFGQAGQAGMMSGNAGGRQAPSFAENTMMSGVDNDRTILRAPGTGLGVVRVEEGKEPGREYEIRKDSLSIGRSRESDIFLEDLAVSRLHASIVNQGNGNYALKDEGSANGTKINGQLVGKYQTFPLQDGDRIQLGQTVLVFGHR